MAEGARDTEGPPLLWRLLRPTPRWVAAPATVRRRRRWDRHRGGGSLVSKAAAVPVRSSPPPPPPPTARAGRLRINTSDIVAAASAAAAGTLQAHTSRASRLRPSSRGRPLLHAQHPRCVAGRPCASPVAPVRPTRCCRSRWYASSLGRGRGREKKESGTEIEAGRGGEAAAMTHRLAGWRPCACPGGCGKENIWGVSGGGSLPGSAIGAAGGSGEEASLWERGVGQVRASR